ncbi:hypothetical protein [Granulicella sibirica]|uniref:Uncharacterized protein n=1 Tax=Granulicella sibirica TaxID=2479048 RepID=A0A4Q0T474_9BACT|nr:hypothetical protein [Granulicella sibirica]RXH58107.1 hypothetical protein GRAN_1417 [Granulicella sibirica]
MKISRKKLTGCISDFASQPYGSKDLVRIVAATALLCSVLTLASGCRSRVESRKPSIIFGHIPPSVVGGPDQLDQIDGRIVNGEPGTQVVIYAQSGRSWFVQPFRSRQLTEVAGDGSWSNVTHFGQRYAALLVRPGYHPTSTISTLPTVNENILAITVVDGSANHATDPVILHFSGYDWKVQTGLGDRSGEVCDYEASDVWVDGQGFLHMLMGQEGGQWHCVGLRLTRSLGYGSYRFVVSNSARLPPSAVVQVFTYLDSEDSAHRTGLGIQLSRWGKPSEDNAGYLVAPYYVPGNSTHFSIPNGLITHEIHWQPGMAEFASFRGLSTASRDRITDHVFRGDIPIPSNETIRLDFYDFHHSHSSLQHPIEIVVQKFEYLP